MEMDFDLEVKCLQYFFVFSLFRMEVWIKDLVVEEIYYDYVLQFFWKVFIKFKSELYYIDIIGDDVFINCDE